MAMKTVTPWWVSGLVLGGLLSLFIGQHAFSHIDAVASVFSWLGILLTVGSTLIRVWAMTRAKGKRKSVEVVMLLCHVGVLAALLVYYLGTDKGVAMFKITDAKAIAKWHTVTMVGWTILLVSSVLPLIMIETSLGFTGRGRFSGGPGSEKDSDEAVELVRVREMGQSGLTIALGLAFLMTTCNIAEQKEIRKDVSYFKTSAPGSATINIAKNLTQPVTVYLFFPEVNEVADEVENYLHDLAKQVGDKIVVERADRLTAPTLAKDLKVNADGTVVFKQGEKSEKFTLKTDFVAARRDELRELDSKVQKMLLQVIRAKRVAYLSTGHGEMNDQGSTGMDNVADLEAKASFIKQGLGQLNYEVKTFDGLGKPVPDDCSMLLVLGPRHALMAEELAAIDTYLSKGGSLIFALDPGSAASLGQLEGRLGVKFNPTMLVEDKEFQRMRGNNSDRRRIITNQFSSHESTTTVSRAGAQAGILLVESGSLEDVPFANPGSADAPEKPKKTFVVRSLANSFRDTNGNDEFDKDSEKRAMVNIVASVEDPTAKPDKPREGEKPRGMRAMIFADGSVFSDLILTKVPMASILVSDAIRWLGGEEEFAGETITEKDVAIEHTQSQDKNWFYANIVGAPLLVLLLGLGFTMGRRMARRKS